MEMDEDLLARIDTAALYQPFLEKCNELVLACLKRGAAYYAICGERTYQQQDGLYQIGRTTGKPGHYVTKAKGGQSVHNFSCAVDWARDLDPSRPGLQPDWDDRHYVILAEEARRIGLDAGYWWPSFQDVPHVNLNLKKYSIKIKQLDEIYRKSGKTGVFALLDQYDWS